MRDEWHLERVTDRLPVGLDALRAEARSGGFRALDRLADEWASGAQRFRQPGEALLAARAGGALVAIGGITADPDRAGAMRMRRFYVALGWRRRGIAAALARALLDVQPRGTMITVHAGTPEAVPFWASLGFVAAKPGASPTHVLGVAARPRR